MDVGSRARDVTEIWREREVLQTCGCRVKGQGCNRNMERLGGVTNRGQRVRLPRVQQKRKGLGGVIKGGTHGDHGCYSSNGLVVKGGGCGWVQGYQGCYMQKVGEREKAVGGRWML